MNHYYVTPTEYEIARRNGISAKHVQNRVYTLNWSKKRAITQPLRKRVNNCPYVKKAKQNGIAYHTYKNRVNILGWSKERASTEKVKSRTASKKRLKIMRELAAKKRRKYPDWVYENLKKNNIPRSTFWNRVNRLGWSIEEASTVKVNATNNNNHVWRKVSEIESTHKSEVAK